MTENFLIVFEQGKESFGAQSPDIPGCFAVGTTLEETRQRFIKAAEAHLQWLANEHEPVPHPVTTTVEFERGNSELSPTYYVEWQAIAMPIEARHALSA